MVNFICNKCNKEFNTKQQLNIHENRKFPCDRILKCNICNKEFKKKHHLTQHKNRKFPCQSVELESKIKELEYKNEILELKLQLKCNTMINSNNNTTINNNNIVVINNFGDEDINFIKKKSLTEQIQRIMDNGIPFQIPHNARLAVEDLNYYGTDIVKIDIFRLFIKLIFKDEAHPENNTIKYDEEEDNFYYYFNKEWCIFEEESKKCLIKEIVDKIQKLLLNKKPIQNESDLRKLDMYLGEDYNIKINKIDQKDYGILSNTVVDKKMYKKVLKIEYKNTGAFDNHVNNVKK